MSEDFEGTGSLEYESDRETTGFLIPDELVETLGFKDVIELNDGDSLTLEVEKQISGGFIIRLISRDFTGEQTDHVSLGNYQSGNRVLYSVPLTNGQIDFIEEVLSGMIFKTPGFVVGEVGHSASIVLGIKT